MPCLPSSKKIQIRTGQGQLLADLLLDNLALAQYLCPFSGPERVRCVFFQELSRLPGVFPQAA